MKNTRARLERGEERRDVGLALERRAGGLHERRRRARAATICASEVLPRPGGPASRTWSSASPRGGGGLDRDARAAPCSASWPTNSSSRRGRSERVERRPRRARAGSGCARRRRRGVRITRRARLAGRAAIRSSGVSPAAPSSSASASCGVKPSPSRPSRASARGSSPRVTTIGSSASRRADLLAQLDDDPLGGALADARARPAARAVSPAATAPQQLARRAAGEHGERHLRADATGRRSAAGRGRAPPRWRSRRACSASSRTIRWRVQRRRLARRAGRGAASRRRRSAR